VPNCSPVRRSSAMNAFSARGQAPSRPHLPTGRPKSRRTFRLDSPGRNPSPQREQRRRSPGRAEAYECRLRRARSPTVRAKASVFVRSSRSTASHLYAVRSRRGPSASMRTPGREAHVDMPRPEKRYVFDGNSGGEIKCGAGVRRQSEEIFMALNRRRHIPSPLPYAICQDPRSSSAFATFLRRHSSAKIPRLPRCSSSVAATARQRARLPAAQKRHTQMPGTAHARDFIYQSQRYSRTLRFFHR